MPWRTLNTFLFRWLKNNGRRQLVDTKTPTETMGTAPRIGKKIAIDFSLRQELLSKTLATEQEFTDCNYKWQEAQVDKIYDLAGNCSCSVASVSPN